MVLTILHLYTAQLRLTSYFIYLNEKHTKAY